MGDFLLQFRAEVWTGGVRMVTNNVDDVDQVMVCESEFKDLDLSVNKSKKISAAQFEGNESKEAKF